jgi:hypothetical protein
MHQGERRIGARQLIGAAGDPVTTPGYSGRPQAAKLGLKPGQRVSLHQPPQAWALAEPPDGLEEPGPDGQADVIVAFFTEAGDIAAQIGALGRRIYPAGALWVAWPRRAAGHRSNITENFIRDQALPIGLVDVKVAAIDDDWSGLRLVWRVENR